MNLYFRLLATLLAGLRRPRLDPDRTLSRRFRVLPHDLDAFGHMNNGRYLQIMDVARVDWMLRTGVLGAMWSEGWGAVLGGNLLRYRHALNLLDSYDVRTRLIHWDSRWFFFEHAFVDQSGRVAALGLSRAALRRRASWVNTDDVVQIVAPDAVNPPRPQHLEDWLLAEETVESHRARLYSTNGANAVEVTS
ncbi:MAG: thioesterase family protein [Pseudomonadota bacterium]